ncbi:MAG: sigma 54-dependent Fis family transcriptional regulator [Deltaproteobacteria bacterium]|nr:sigma 54-dependent Fis family transcriptional regulator [Deltaproteobacteria bacterium]
MTNRTQHHLETQHAGERAAVNLAQCKLVVIKGMQRGREHTIASDVIRVGKSEDNDLVLPDETVSRVHFEIIRDPKGYLLRDLHSTNGTFLDGAEVREAYLRTGSLITAGGVQLKFQPFEERIEILPTEASQLGELAGGSLRMREIFGLVERIAPTEATILLEGETGTGKDLVARTLHALSRRKAGPFIVVDCGAVAGSLIESELFGHEKGAFTGAAAARQGAFELAAGGTIFLDELGELSLDLQPKLLRVLEQREIRRVGGNRTIKIDIRVVAATKKDLRSEVEKGKFREDLYFRLNVVPITMPPLRERKMDIPLLARTFLERLQQSGAVAEVPELSQATLSALEGHDWPGNVRELRNVLERGVYMSAGMEGGLRLPLMAGAPGGMTLQGQSQAAGQAAGRALEVLAGGGAPGAAGDLPPFNPELSFRDNKEKWSDEFERRYLKWLLERNQGNISKAAREADMDRKYLHKLLKKHEIM